MGDWLCSATTNCADDEQMTESIGLDIVENARIERLLTKQPERFVERILGPEVHGRVLPIAHLACAGF